LRNYQVEFFAPEKMLTKSYLTILNPKQAVVRRHEQLVHKLINSTGYEPNIFEKLDASAKRRPTARSVAG
jgi:hypothetical protein